MVEHSLVPVVRVERAIVVLRGHKVMLDETLAELYGVPVKVLNQAVKRNIERFPDAFMFQLTPDESERLRSQSVTSKLAGRGGRRYSPYAFTEQGVAMLSTVLTSPQAVQVNIEIVQRVVAQVPWRRNIALLERLGEDVRCAIPRGLRRHPRPDGAYAQGKATHRIRQGGSVMRSVAPKKLTQAVAEDRRLEVLVWNIYLGRSGESAKLEQAIKVNLRGLAYGG